MEHYQGHMWVDWAIQDVSFSRGTLQMRGHIHTQSGRWEAHRDLPPQVGWCAGRRGAGAEGVLNVLIELVQFHDQQHHGV